MCERKSHAQPKADSSEAAKLFVVTHVLQEEAVEVTQPFHCVHCGHFHSVDCSRFFKFFIQVQG